MIETVVRDRRSSIVGEKNMSHFPFRGSPNTQNPNSSVNNSTSSGSPPPPSGAAPATGMAVTSTVPPGARSASPCSATSGPPNSNSRCCDTGRPIYTDPITGQTLCSCQYDILNYSRLANAGISGPGGVPLSMYSTPYSAEGMAAYFPALGADQAPFYPNPAGMDLKENLAAGGAPWPYPSVYHPYDAAFAGYPFNGYGMDLNGARRKNATRETTSTLKAWLNEHKKNPYPTKGEKIMLAIITKMTLTQVSTWFANARRRLKKENKMTWEPRNRVEDDDVNLDDDDHKSTDEKDLLDSKDSGTGSSEDGDRPSRLDLLDRPSGNSEWNESRNGSGPNSPDIYDHRTGVGHPLLHPAHMHHLRPPPQGSPPPPHHTNQLAGGGGHPGVGLGHTGTGNGGLGVGGSTNSSVISKPRIWSLADMASKESKDPDASSVPTTPPTSMYSSSPGKIISPLAARGLHPLHHPYMRPELYRSFYGPGLGGGPPDVALLESYQRFGASLAHHNGLGGPLNHHSLSSVISKASGSCPPFGPLSLTTNSHLHNNHMSAPQPGASPASSTSSGPEITTTPLSLPSGDKSSPSICVVSKP